MADPVKPKKHLGQHFLKDENIARKIVDALNDQSGSLVEIGPGIGVLTQHLIYKENFIAMDIDVDSVEYLKKKYPDQAHKVVLQDFLDSAMDNLTKPISIIGNLPYNISSQIFFKIYDSRDQVHEVVCMIQKEVADRIAAPSGNKTYGILSVLLQAFFDIKLLFVVKPGVFNPPPKVNSAVIRMERNKTLGLDCDEVLFKRVVKMAFGKRRKTLRNALKEFNLSAEITGKEIFSKRAEQLNVDQFVSLTRMIQDGDANNI